MKVLASFQSTLLVCTLAFPGSLHGRELDPFTGAAVPDTVVIELDELVHTAVEKTIGLRIQRLDRTIARAGFLHARSAFDPDWALNLSRAESSSATVQASGDQTENRSTNSLQASLGGLLPFSTGYSFGLTASEVAVDPIAPSVGPFRENYSTRATFSLTQPLLRGFGPEATTALRRSAREAALGAEEDLKRNVEEAIAAVEEAFWALQLMQESETIARESLERTRELRDRNASLHKLDLISELDLITAERALSLKEILFITAKRNRADAAEALVFLVYGEETPRALLGQGAVILARSDSPAAPGTVSYEELEARALLDRNDAHAARRRLASADAGFVYARDRKKPGLDLGFDVSYGGLSGGVRPFSYTEPDNSSATTYSLGLSFAIPQFNWRAEAESIVASAQVEQARLSLVFVENQIRKEVRAADRGTRLARESFDQAQHVETLAQQEYRIAERGLELGQVSTFQLFQYEEELVSARLTKAQQRYTYFRAVTAYRLAVGSIEDPYGIDLSPDRSR